MTETPEGVVVTQELMACPFCCGEFPPMATRDRTGEVVICVSCSAMGPTRRTVTDAIAAWNARAHTPTLRGEEVERIAATIYGHFYLRTAYNYEKQRVLNWPELPADNWYRQKCMEVAASVAALSQPLAVDTGQGGKFVKVATGSEIAASVLAVSTCGKEEAVTPAPSVSPDPAGEVQKAWQRISDALDGIEGGMHAELEDAASAMWPLIDALASSPIPKTFPREAVERVSEAGEYLYELLTMAVRDKPVRDMAEAHGAFRAAVSTPPTRGSAIVSDLRVRRRGKEWGVQERRGWFWRWIGPFGDASLGKWVTSADALAFANWCERYDLRQPAAPPAWPWQTPQAQEKRP